MLRSPQEFCLKFIVKENTYNKIVMSKEFEIIAQPLMVEIIRRKQAPNVRLLLEPQFDSAGTNTPTITYSHLIVFQNYKVSSLSLY